MTLVDMKPSTFVVGKEGLDMCSLFVQPECFIKVIDVGDEIDCLLILLLPQRQQADGTVVLCGHPRRRERQQFTALGLYIPNTQLNPICAEQDVRASAAHILPFGTAQVTLEVGSIELTITQKGHISVGWHNLKELCQQLLMVVWGKCPLEPPTTTQHSGKQRP